MTELTIGQMVLCDVLGWIYDHPPKHLKKLRIKTIYLGKIIEDEDVKKLCSMPALSTITSLHLGCSKMTNKGCSFIANCEHFKNLTKFTVIQAKCNEEGVNMIVRSKYMNNLTSLSFNQNRFNSLEGVFSSPLFLRMKKLDLSYCSLDKNLFTFPQVMPLLEDLTLRGKGFKSKSLMALTQTRNLTRLNLCKSDLADEGCKIIAENQYLSKLTDLDLSYVKISTTGLKHIVSSPYFKQLKCLNLENTSIESEGRKILAESENMRNLTSLKLGTNDDVYVTADGLYHVFNSDNLCNIQSLSLKGLALIGTNFGDMLMKSSLGKNLKSLTLYCCDLDLSVIQHVVQLDGLRELELTNDLSVSDNVSECIASSSHMSSVTSLTLRCNITDSGCLHLANSVYLTQLTTLDLSSYEIGNDGCKHFANSANFPNLTTLDLTYNNMNHVGLEMISNSPFFKTLKLLTD